MSASTMTFLGVAPGAATPGVAADGPVADGADFTAALAALVAAPVTAGSKAAPPVALPADSAPDEALPDADAMAALLAGMLPVAPTPTPVAEAGLPAVTGDGEDSLDPALAHDDALAADVLAAEAAAAAAAALPVTEAASSQTSDAGPVPPQSPQSVTKGWQPPAAAQVQQDEGEPSLPVLAQQAEDAASQATGTSPVAATPATQAAASLAVNAALAASGAAPRDNTSSGRADARTTTQALRNLMQALAWSEAAGNRAAPAETAPTAMVTAPAPQPAPALQDTQLQQAAREPDIAPVPELPPQASTQTELPEQANAPAPATGAVHAGPASTVAATTPEAGQAVRTPVGTPRWAEELGNQLVLMNARNQQEGSLSLTPEHLGPLEVRISVSHNTANVWFGAQHADTRAALNEAMPRLRELFNEAGLSLGHAGVSQEAPRQDRREPVPELGRINGAQAPELETDVPATVRRISRGLLDTYA